MLSYIVLPLMAAAVQILRYGMPLINLSIGIAMIFMYIASMSEQNREMYQLKKKNKIIGFLGVDNPRNHYDDPTLLSSIQYFIINSIERKEKQHQLEDLSYRDMLTGLYNRNKYIRVVESYDGKVLHNVGVAYIDLNGLKKMNDVHGHEAGDALICRTESAIAAVFSGNAFRVGGDEFVVAQSEIAETEFLKKIDQLHKEMDNRKVSVSIGVLWKEKQKKHSIEYKKIKKSWRNSMEDNELIEKYLNFLAAAKTESESVTEAIRIAGNAGFPSHFLPVFHMNFPVDRDLP